MGQLPAGAIKRRVVVSALAEWNPVLARADLAAARGARGWSYFAHDALNRVTAEKSPDASTASYAYGPGGHRASVAVGGNRGE